MSGNAVEIMPPVRQHYPSGSFPTVARSNHPVAEGQAATASNKSVWSAYNDQRVNNAYATRGDFNGNSSGNSRQNQGGLHVRHDWESRSELTVMLKHFPNETKTVDLWRAMKMYGSVVGINIILKANMNHAFIDFSPVPQTPFWNAGRISMTVGGKHIGASIQLAKPKLMRTVKSPMRAGVAYPEHTTLHLSSMDFGFLSQEHTMDIMRTVDHHIKYPSSFGSPAFNFTINLNYKNIKIRFPCFIQNPRKEVPKLQRKSPSHKIQDTANFSEYLTEIKFHHIKRVYCLSIDSNYWALLIPLSSPPIFFRRKTDLAKTHKDGETRWRDHDTWVRTAEITFDPELYKHDHISLQRQHQFIDMGKWTTYRLVVRKVDTGKTWETMRAALQEFNIQVVNTNSDVFKIQRGNPSSFWEMVDAPFSGSVKSELALLLQNQYNAHLPFEVRYQLEAAISQGVFTEQSITLEFLKKIEELHNNRGKYINKAKNILEYVTDAGERIYNPMSIFQDKAALSHYAQVGLPEHCAWMRKVIVTPSTVYIGTPMPETTNRVLRQYANNSDRFIRVQFTDERIEGGIRSVPNRDVNDALFNRVFRTLQNGIRVGGRNFQFLAFGNSQFRENGAYFFSPADYLSCVDIRNWMGDFSHIKVVAKYASRLGQCFSTTREPRDLHLPMELEEIPDIEHNGWCFSDGVGKISKLMARQIADRLQLNNHGKTPSAFQFRLGGNKGILVTCEDEKKEDYRKIKLRPSQKKFNARAKSIEIIRSSRSSAATLNRQTIAIFSCLGVPDKVFMDLTEDQLSDYSQAMTDPEVALKTLNRFTDQNGMTITMAQMITDGFMTIKEPFMQVVLQLWKAWSMKLLREKARIVVEKGAFVLGCVDETNTLRGYKDVKEADLEKDCSKLAQIFLQVPKQIKSAPDRLQDKLTSYQIITGLCVVGRNPSLHPGDLRVVEAIDVPELRELRDVVVFPAHGDRDIPSMCSGGDLDGDDYFVIWDERLIPEEWNYPPMIHDTDEPNEHNGDVQIKDIARFFVNYMKNNSLSTIALAHVALADQSPEGPKDERCIELAKLHSNAVDYVKTGRRAIMRNDLSPRQWPHFMERRSKTYKSSSVLGKLYDLVTSIDFSPDFDGPFDQRILRRYQLDQDILRRARVIKTQYDISMCRIMNQWEIKTEFEVWTSFVLTKPRVGTDYKVQEDMGIVMTSLRDRFTKECREAAKTVGKIIEERSDLLAVTITLSNQNEQQKPADRAGMVDEDAEGDMLNRFIAATYRITWEEVQIALQESKSIRLIAGRLIPKRSKDEMPPISFPWLFCQELGRIARDASEGELELEQMPPIPQITKVNDVEDAANHSAASLGDKRLFHRGEELFKASESVIPDETAPELEVVYKESTEKVGLMDEIVEEAEEAEEAEEVEVNLEEDSGTGLDVLEHLAL